MDIGCGPGTFFAEAEAAGKRCRELIGVDFVGAMLEAARARRYESPVRFMECDLAELPDAVRDLDLVTLVGVLQQCGMPPEKALAACVERLRVGGQLFLTTKNIGWRAFREEGLIPFEGHSWFDHDELAEQLQACGLKIRESGGFLPRENRRVPVNDSHTMYVLGERVH